MNPHKALNLIQGFLVILGIFSGYWIGTLKAKNVFDIMNGLLNSERSIEATLNIRVLGELREKEIEKAVEIMQVHVKSALENEGIEPVTIAKALEYQTKYCKSSCLGLK
jgi:hypothetical protein